MSLKCQNRIVSTKSGRRFPLILVSKKFSIHRFKIRHKIGPSVEGETFLVNLVFWC